MRAMSGKLRSFCALENCHHKREEALKLIDSTMNRLDNVRIFCDIGVYRSELKIHIITYFLANEMLYSSRGAVMSPKLWAADWAHSVFVICFDIFSRRFAFAVAIHNTDARECSRDDAGSVHLITFVASCQFLSLRVERVCKQELFNQNIFSWSCNGTKKKPFSVLYRATNSFSSSIHSSTLGCDGEVAKNAQDWSQIRGLASWQLNQNWSRQAAPLLSLNQMQSGVSRWKCSFLTLLVTSYR